MTDPAQQSWPEQPQPPRSNTMGIVGFVLSFCISPIGLLISLIALAKPPRGFAIAGTVIGLIGTVIWASIGVGAYFGGGIMVKGFGLGMDYSVVESQLSAYAGAHNGESPPDLATAGVPESARKDPWDRDYRYERGADGKGWSMTSAGFDGQFGTADDAVFKDHMTQRDIQRVINDSIEAHMGKQGAAPSTTPTPESAPPPAPAEEKKPE